MKPATCHSVLSCIDRSPAFRQELQKRLSVANEFVDSYNICRIHVHTRVFDWTQPPNRNKGSQGTGTGFIIEALSTDHETYIVTAHHVVANSVKINVNFAKISSEYIEAKMVGCNVDMDVAVIVIEDPNFMKSMKSKYDNVGLHLGNSDMIRPPATVTAHGFALGNTQMQTTKGVVSARVDNPSRLQTDVAVNPGNSGGPLLDESNRLIGIVTSGRTDAQGINFAAPITESMIMINRIVEQYSKTGQIVYDRIATVNSSFTKSNRVLLDSIKNCNSGVYTTSVHPSVLYPQTPSDALENILNNMRRSENGPLAQSKQLLESNQPVFEAVQRLLREHKDPFKFVMTQMRWSRFISEITMSNELRSGIVLLLRNDVLQDGDIVCSMVVNDKEYDIDLQMTAKFDFWHDRVNFQAIFDRMSCANGECVHFKYFRNGSLATTKMTLQPNLNAYRKMYADADAVPYLVMGGVFVMPLMLNHVPLFRNEPLYTLLTRPDNRHLSILVVTHILPESPFNECESIGVGDVLVSINDRLTTSIEEACDLWHHVSSDAAVVTLRMRDGSLATASREDIKKANARIISEYKSDEYVGFHVVRFDLKANANESSPLPLRSPAPPESPPVQPPPALPDASPFRPTAPPDSSPRPSPETPASTNLVPRPPVDAASAPASETQNVPLSLQILSPPLPHLPEVSKKGNDEDLISETDDEEEELSSEDATVRREISDSEADDDAVLRSPSSASSSDSSLSTIVDEVKSMHDNLKAIREMNES